MGFSLGLQGSPELRGENIETRYSSAANNVSKLNLTKHALEHCCALDVGEVNTPHLDQSPVYANSPHLTDPQKNQKKSFCTDSPIHADPWGRKKKKYIFTSPLSYIQCTQGKAQQTIRRSQ